MIIKKFLNSISISPYTIILIFLAFLAGLFKEIIVITIIIIFHEFGHFICLYKYKWNIKKIIIYPFGGITNIDDEIDKPLNEEFLITLFGPLFQEILFIIIFCLYLFHVIDEYIFILFKNYNFTILIFNLLPILPLDGSKLLNVFINKIFNFRLSYFLNIIISSISLLMFFTIFKNDTSYYIIIVFLLYQIIYYYKNRYIIFNRFILEKRLRNNKYIKYKKINNVKRMYRNKRHLFKTKDRYITEKEYIKSRF